MPRYISLISFTEQGIKSIKDWDKRIAASRERLAKSGGALVDVYLTLGPYDAVVITEAPNDDAALRGALEYGLAGNGRTQTMRAFGESEALKVIRAIG
jgi:uncharacterized protein with GYD domain